MRILFDHGVPVPLRAFIEGHVVDTAFERGWSTITNSELIRAAEDSGYDLWLTTDKSLRYQQRLRGRSVTILVLSTTS